MKFVKSHTGLLRSARSGGSLRLRTTVLLLLGLSLLGNLGNPNTVWAQPDPDVGLNVPAEVLIGEDFTFEAKFVNIGTVIGFGPYIELYLPAKGADDNMLGLKCDGISFVKAEALFTNPPTVALTPTYNSGLSASTNNLDCPNPYSLPFAGMIFAGPPLGDYQLVVLELPPGSFDPSQPETIVRVTAHVSDYADVGTPLMIYARGGFRYGMDELDNPLTDPLIQSIYPFPAETTPTVFEISKKYLGPEGEAVAGPNFINYYPLKYEITVNIADGQTIHNLVIQDVLPIGLQFAGNVQVSFGGLPSAGGVLASPVASCPPKTPTTGPPVVISTPPTGPGGTISVTLCNPIQGQAVPDDIVITFEFYIPNNVLDADCAHSPVFIGNNIKATGDWVPLDPRDGTTPVQVISDKPGPEHELQGKCLAIQKGVEVYPPSLGLHPVPGDTLKYTLSFQVSDYHTIGNLKITDILGDGQDFLTGPPFVPTYTVADQFGPESGNFTLNADLTATPDAAAAAQMCKHPLDLPQGGTILKFDVSQAMIHNPPPLPRPGIMTGGYAAGFPPSPIRATGTIVFYAKIRDDFQFSVSPGDKFVDKDDPINNCVTIEGKVYKNVNKPAIPLPTSIIGSAGDDSASQVTIVTDFLKKSVYAVKRGTNWVCGPPSLSNTACSNLPGPPQDVHPRDQVTFRLTYAIPSSDAENLTIQDWLPLPVFDVADPNGTLTPALQASNAWSSFNVAIPLCLGTGTAPPAAGYVCRLSTDTLTAAVPPVNFATPPPTPTLSSVDGATNSLTFTYGTFYDTNNAHRTIDLVFTIVANPKPFADGLLLTNEAQECEDNTFGVKFCQTAIARVNVREPNLNIRKGAIATDNTYGQFTQPTSPLTTPPTALAPQGVTFNLAGFTGVINSTNLVGPINLNPGAPINSDLLNVDANDLVTFAVVIENQGGHPAFNVHLDDLIPWDKSTGQPTCFELIPNSLSISNGSGLAVPAPNVISGSGFGILLTNPIPALDASTASGGANSGANIIVITFQVKLLSSIKPGCCDNLVKLTQYTSTSDPNAPNFVAAGFGGPFQDTAKVCVGPWAYAKCIQTTSELHTIPPSAPQNGTVSAAIGEIVRFRLITVIPEGITKNFQIQDLLPVGLTYVGKPTAIFVANNPVVITGHPPIPTISGNETTVGCPGPPPPPATPTPVPITVSPNSFPFGTGIDPNFPVSPITITNYDNDTNLELLIIEFNAQVDNIGSNQDVPVTILTNRFEVHYQDKAGNSFSSTSGPVYVKIVEPNLTITKNVNPTTVPPGGTVTYTVHITNTGTADAFDIVFTDTLQTGLTLVNSGFPVPSGCKNNSSLPGNINVTCTKLDDATSMVPITYQAQVPATAPCPSTLTNTAKVTWTSLPGSNGTCPNPTGSCTVGNPGAIDGERDGVTSPLTLNDYAATASAVLTVKCPSECVAPLTDMVSWWPLDELPGDPKVIDIWDSNHGTAMNAAIGAPGGPVSLQGQYVGNSLFFSGSYVDVSPATTLDFGTGEFSIDAWVNTPSGTPNYPTTIQPIVDKTQVTGSIARGYALFIYYPANSPTGQVYLGFVIDDGVTPPAATAPILHTIPLSPGWHWHHVAVTVARPTSSTATVTLYVDGAPSAPVTVTVGSTSNGAALWIGKSRLDALLNASLQEVAIDELEIFKRALSQSEIQDIYSADKKGKCKSDLGDAPDSTNHANTQMDAYPNIPASFPTVYDPNLAGNTPPGPIHLNAKGDAWLGTDVTFEGEADQGGDQDTVNNIAPITNTPNKDNADDGVILPINLPTVGCGTMQFQYTVTVVGPLKPRYVNVWFDFNQDGDWQYVIPCLGSGTALVAREWAVQNQMFNNGPGFYTILTPVFVGFRRTIGPPGMWMRITLTDTPVASAQGADGSGPVGGYKFGETEDYLLDMPPVVKPPDGTPVVVKPVEITPGLGTGAEICVTKFNDLDGNGVQDLGEPGLPGWTFTVTPGGPTISTGPQGTFCFGVPAPGTYTISEVLQPGWTPTTPNSQTVTVSAGLVNLKFGNQKKDDDNKCDLKIEKFTDPSPPVAGQPFAFVVRVTNVGGAVCPPTTTVTDNLPSGFTVTSFNPNTTAGWVCTAPPGITCTNSTLTLQPGQSSMVFAVVGTIAPGTTIENCAELKNPNDTNPNNNKDCIKVTVAPPVGTCDLVIGKSPSRGSIPLKSGQQGTFELVVTNQGTGPCSAPIQVTDALPPGLTFVTGGPPPWTCVGPTCTYNLALAPGQSALLLTTVNVTAPPGTSVKNCAGVKHPQDTNPANNEVCIGVPVAPPVEKCDLAMRKSVSPNPATSGQPVTIALTVTNVGTGLCRLDTVVQDPRPAGLTFTAAPVTNQPGWACSLPGGNASCVTAGPLPSGYTATFTSTATVTASPGGTITNCATVSNPADINPANNQSCATIRVQRGVGPPPRPFDPKGLPVPPPPRPFDPKGLPVPPPPRPFDPKGLEGR
jgi:uncharacterized repeat protein (TIGR01451 family)